jgi:radical SAM protein with 4Fe4S-binding SPASM domain
MKKLYTGFSNYKEVNTKKRVAALDRELILWGKDSVRFKKYRQEWKKATIKDYVPAHPLHVDLEVSDSCNLQCAMCMHGISGKKPIGGMIEHDFLLKMIAECARIGVYSIKFNWRGEPLLYSRLAEAVKAAKDSGILEVQINTNGMAPQRHPAILEECAEAGIDRVIFSIDGFSAKTYEAIRKGGKYEQVVENVHRLIAWKRVYRSAKPFIRVQMVRNTLNAHEVPAFLKYWEGLVDDVRISDVMDRGQGGKLSVGDQVMTGRRKCPQPFQRLTIARSGKVSPCCADWDQKYIIGDAAKEGLLSIWMSSKMKSMRAAQTRLKHDSVDICRQCCVKESYTWKKVKK